MKQYILQSDYLAMNSQRSRIVFSFTFERMFLLEESISVSSGLVIQLLSGVFLNNYFPVESKGIRYRRQETAYIT